MTLTALPLLVLLFLQAAQQYAKATREQRMRAESLVEIVVPVSEAVWEEEGKELRVGGRIFDVSGMAVNNGHYYLTGVYDEEETSLMEWLLYLWDAENSLDVLELLFLLQCFAMALYLFCFEGGPIQKRTLRRLRVRLPFVYASVLESPPWPC